MPKIDCPGAIQRGFVSVCYKCEAPKPMYASMRLKVIGKGEKELYLCQECFKSAESNVMFRSLILAKLPADWRELFNG